MEDKFAVADMLSISTSKLNVHGLATPSLRDPNDLNKHPLFKSPLSTSNECVDERRLDQSQGCAGATLR